MILNSIFDHYVVCGKSDVGLQRKHNEDNILIDSHIGLLVVADGMGGHEFGERASLEAINTLRDLLSQKWPMVNKPVKRKLSWSTLVSAVKKQANPSSEAAYLELMAEILNETHQHIIGLNQSLGLPQHQAMGTTLVGCILLHNQAKMLIFHVGDSRLYRFRQNQLTVLTKDHSAYQLWLDMGQKGKQPGTNIILQGLGTQAEILPDIKWVDIQVEDCFLLCSDGLNDMLTDKDIAHILQNTNKDNIASKAQQLIDTVNQNGGADNVSVILLGQ